MSTERVPDSAGRQRMWRLVSTASGMAGGLAARKVMRTLFEKVRKDKDAPSPFDPTSAEFSWPDVVVWGVAAGIGLGVAKVVSARVALIGWEAATGTRPPGFEAAADS